MTGKEIVDFAIQIIKRQDVTDANRTFLLSCINLARRSVLRDKTVERFMGYKTDIANTDGVIDMTTMKIKNPRYVEWQYTADDDTVKRILLHEIYSYKQAMQMFGSLTATGNPAAYLKLGASMYILPVLLTGQINIYGEFWPDELADSAASSDVTTVELPEAWAYLGAAEYLDTLGEGDINVDLLRKKGQYIVEQYITQWSAQKGETYDLWRRKPLGKGRTIPHGASSTSSGEDFDFDMGEWE